MSAAPAIDDTPQPDVALHERNMETFRTRMPGVHALLSKHTPTTRLIFTDSGEPDIEFQGTCVYGRQGAHTYARQQIDAFFKNPASLRVRFPDSRTLDAESGVFATEFIATCSKEKIEFDLNPTTRKAYFLSVLGVGLGVHLKDLITETGCQRLSLFEPNIDFLYHSTFVTDWNEILELMREPRTLTLHPTTDPREISRIIQSEARAMNPSGLDGFYLYMHFANDALSKAVTDICSGDLATGMMGLGFFQDEKHMIANSYENLRHGRVRIAGECEMRGHYPAFILGGGPSLDGALDFIRENQDRAVLISCGSGLRPLLANGIRPDFHILLEQDYKLLSVTNDTLKEFGLDDICLIGATNLYPGVMDRYPDVITFFRPGLSCFPLFTTAPRQHLDRPDPMVANGGLAWALRGPFTKIYMFGVDCGSRVSADHHSKHSIYTTAGLKFNHPFKIPVQGNFGGTVYSADVMMWSKRALEISLKAKGAGKAVFNCSDGALIEGAKPLRPEAVKLPEMPGKKAVVRELIDSFAIYTTQDFETAWAKADMMNRVPEICDAVKGHVVDGDLDDMEYMTHIMKILSPGEVKDAAALMLRGTIYMMLAVAYVYRRYVRNPDDLARYQEICKTVFADHMDKLKGSALNILEDIVEGRHEWVVDIHNPPSLVEVLNNPAA